MFSNLVEIVKYHAKISPDNPALAFMEKQYSYSGLNDTINSLAVKLKEAKHKNGERIGILLPNSDVFIQALFAIFEISASAVLLNPVLHPKEFIAFAKDSELSAMLLTTEQYDKIHIMNIEDQIIALRTIFVWDEKKKKLCSIKIKSPPKFSYNRTIESSLTDAVTIYTSGTTGSSKGVVLTHDNLLKNTVTAANVLGISPKDRSLVAMPLCHSYTLTLQFLTHLLLGAYSRILPPFTFPDTINRTIETDQTSTFSGTTYLFSRMVERGAGKRYPMKSLRMVTSGAAFMPEDIRKKWLKLFPTSAFFATYGLSEASPLVTVLPKKLAFSKPISVGRTIPGVEYKILPSENDNNHNKGELLIRGPNIMKGYYNNPDATKIAIDSEDWLHTGDLVSVDNDGDIIIIGRSKEMILRGGENIYPGEVEVVIAKHPDVAEVAIIGIPDQTLGEAILAAVVPKVKSISYDDVINICRENLAPFKIPGKIIFMDRFEKTHTGKIKKKSLFELYMKTKGVKRRK